jgi:hypothetical protein
VTPIVVIVQILISQRHSEYLLAYQLGHIMLDQVGLAIAGKAPRNPIPRTNCPIRRSQKHAPVIALQRAGIECRHHSKRSYMCKLKRPCATLRRPRGTPLLVDKPLWQRRDPRFRAPIRLLP